MSLKTIDQTMSAGGVGSANHAGGQPRLLLVEDDATLRGVMRDYLTAKGLQVLEAGGAAEFWQIFNETSVDLILLDLSLPDTDGLELLRQIRSHRPTPVFVVSGRREDASRLAALELSANDYITKPFNARELELRIRNFLHCHVEPNGSGQPPESHRLRGWTVVPAHRMIYHDSGATATLTRGEMELLCALLSGAGAVLSRDRLLDALCRAVGGASPETLTVLVSRLRAKLAAGGEGKDLIVTVHGVGYRLQPELLS